MKTSLTVWQSSDQAFEALPLDWFGQPARYQSSFLLAQEQDTLHFGFRTDKRPECDFSHRPGDFVEGLWEQDVAELFIMAPDGRYLEFNLSPCGAWWCAIFSGYRRREREFQCPSARVSARSNDEGWQARLSVSLADIVVLKVGSLQDARFSVTAILNPAEPEYLCYGHEKGGQPDFHSMETFLPAAIVATSS